jgi:ribosomal protein S20
MKPDWDKLMKEYEGSSTVLIADVDCTTGGKELCNSVGVRGYPTIKSGDPNDLQDYKGGRSFNDLKKHAESLGPTCGPANLDLCDAEKKAKIEEFLALSAEKRAEMIKEKEAESEKLESDFKAFVEDLNKQYKEESEKKDNAAEALKNSGLGLLKAVHKFEGKKAKGEL